MNVQFLSVVPSPYQRDLFRAIATLRHVDLRVAYFESAAPDSPWEQTTLEPWESVLPGFCLGRGRVRSHFNWRLPDLTQADIVVVNAALTDLTTQRLLRQRSKFAPNSKWLFWGELIRNGTGLAGRVRRALSSPLNNLDGIVAIGSRAKDDYQRRFPNQKIYQVPYFCEVQKFIDAADRDRPPLDQLETDAPLRLIFCGQMIHRKGVDLLLTAFDRLIQNGADIQLTLIGREAELATWLNPLPATTKDRIDFVGFKAVTELPELFATAEVFVLPSRHDGWGVVINQAIAAGLAIVSTANVGACHDLVDHGQNGILVNTGSTDAIANTIGQLCENRQQVAQMQADSRQRRDSLQPSSGAARWHDVFKQVSQ